MSIFKSAEQEVYLFSPFKGKITKDGKPVANAQMKLELTWHDGDEKQVHQYQTDDDGVFSIPEHKTKMKLHPLVQFSVAQAVLVYLDDVEYEISIVGKSKPEKFSELGGEAIGLTCELNDQLERIKANTPLYATRCKWQSIK